MNYPNWVVHFYRKLGYMPLGWEHVPPPNVEPEPLPYQAYITRPMGITHYEVMKEKNDLIESLQAENASLKKQLLMFKANEVLRLGF